QVYLRAYPNSVRTVYLGSVVPIDVVTPLTMAKTAQAVLEGTISACAEEPACSGAFPNLHEEFTEIWERLEAGDVRGPVPRLSGMVPLHRGRVAEWFRSLLYRPATAASLPSLIHQAYLGNWNPIAEGIISNACALGLALSLGVLFSITCNEDIAFVRDDDI